MGLAEGRAGGRGDERASARKVAVARGAGFPGLVHVGDRAQEVEEIPVREPEHQDERARHEHCPQRGEKTRPWRRDGEEDDDGDGGRGPHDDERRRRQAL